MKHMSYAGMSAGAKAKKYAGCRYGKNAVRLLTRHEVEQFQRYVGWLADFRPLPEPRKRRAVV